MTYLMLIEDTTNSVSYHTKHSAGFDIQSTEDKTIHPNTMEMFKTGLYIKDYRIIPLEKQLIWLLPELQIRSRSGLAKSFGLCVFGGVSTIDADYTGEITVMLHNLSNEPYRVTIGARIAQAVCNLIYQVEGVKIEQTVRGSKGFGSTGT